MTVASKLLRRPEAEKFYNAKAAKGYDATRLVNIRSPHPPAEIARPVDWRMNPYGDKTWQLYFHSLGWMQLFVYAIDAPLKAPETLTDPLDDLKSIAMSCVEDVLSAEPNLKSPQWDDHAAAYRLSNLSFFYAHALEPVLSEAERAAFRKAIALHAKVVSGFIDSGKWDNSNHLIFHVEGIADAWAVFRDDLPELEDMSGKAVDAIIGFIDRSISEEGTTNEHASFYQAFLMNRISETIAYFEGLGRPLPVDVAPRMRKAAAFLWNIMPRWGVLPSFGDTQFDKKLGMHMVERFRHAPWVGPEYLRWHDPDHVRQQPEPLVSYPENGFHILRNGPVRADTALYSLFLERPFRGPHGHWDGNSFMTYYGGEPFLIDSGGPYKYGDKLRYQYFQTQLAHNSVIFGGAHQQLETRVVASGAEDGLTYVIGRGTFPDGSVWLRIFGHLDGTAAFAVDLARPGADAAGTPPVALFHVSPRLKVLRDGEDGMALRTAGAETDALLSHARPGGPEPAALSEARKSMVTSVDTRYDEGILLEQPLRTARPLLTLCSFGEEVARHVAVEDGACRMTLGRADGTTRSVTIPLPSGLLDELGPPAPDAEDTPELPAHLRDEILVINLDSDRSRWTELQSEIDRIGYEAHRVGGVRGLYLPKLAVEAIPGAAGVERGTLGCFLSHLRAWEEIADGVAACGFVVEDDTAFADWLPRGLAQLVAGSGCDFVTCNRRIQEDETQPVEDRSDQTPRVDPLIDAVLKKDKAFRAPGGEGYLLTRDGARALIDMVRTHGIHGDVDWFVLWAALAPEERARVAPGSRLHTHFGRLDRLYPEKASLRGGVLSPWMVRHTAPKSSRKQDNDAARGSVERPEEVRKPSVPRQYRIEGRPRAVMSQSKPTDFRQGEMLSEPFPLARATAYIADFGTREMVFTALPKEPKLLKSPFFYVAQRTEADMVSRVPFDGLKTLYPDDKPLDPMMVMSIGRCGSELVSDLLSAAGMAAISEPEPFSQAMGLRGTLDVQKDRPKGTAQRDAKSVLRATVRSLGQWADVPPSRMALKLRSQANVAIGPILSALPEARYVFIFRQLDPWIRSFVTGFDQRAEQVASTLFRGILACAEIKRVGHVPRIVWYEDLKADPEKAVHTILGKDVDLTADQIAAVRGIAAAQAGTSMPDDAKPGEADIDAKVARVTAEFHDLWKEKRPSKSTEELGLPY